ncbi:hypothetical protein ACVWZ6_007028 [Bradyrhizobium sp. GM6.1]
MARCHLKVVEANDGGSKPRCGPVFANERVHHLRDFLKPRWALLLVVFWVANQWPLRIGTRALRVANGPRAKLMVELPKLFLLPICAVAFLDAASHPANMGWGKDPERPASALCSSQSATWMEYQLVRRLPVWRLRLRDWGHSCAVR